MTVDAPDDLMRNVQPSLVSSLERRRNTDGELILVGLNGKSYLTVSDEEAAAIELIDGELSLNEIVRKPHRHTGNVGEVLKVKLGILSKLVLHKVLQINRNKAATIIS